MMSSDTDLPGELIGAIVDSSAIDAASSLAEVGIDALLDDGLLRDIPIVEVVSEPRREPWGKTARYLDPDGNIVSITEA
jgi:hypothetical protein